MRLKPANPDAELAENAARQHGAVTVAQMRAAGLSQSGIARRVRARRLHRKHRGVYAVGHPALSFEGRCMAAALACGAGAVVSHRSAAALWSLVSSRHGPIDITVPTSAGRGPRKGIRVHRSPSLPRTATAVRDGIPVTNVARTLADLRRVLPAGEWRQAVREAEYRRYPTGLETDGTRSEAEADFLALCRRHRVPPPEVNQRVGRFTIDFLWRAERVVIEIDGYGAHRGRQAFEDDRERDLELRALGFAVLRFSARQVRRSPGKVAATVRGALPPP